MPAIEIATNKQLQQVLWACYEYWRKDPSETDERCICYSWVVKVYEEKFGSRFNQAALLNLVKLGFLQKDETSRGGARRYYRIINPTKVTNELKKYDLDQ